MLVGCACDPRGMTGRAIAVVFVLLACGEESSSNETLHPRDEDTSGDVVDVPPPQRDAVDVPVQSDVVTAADEVDPQTCTSHSECMVGTPRNCCASYCPHDVQAWSRRAWAEYQDECAVEECAVLEDAACRPEPPPRVEARCVEARCVLALTPD